MTKALEALFENISKGGWKIKTGRDGFAYRTLITVSKGDFEFSCSYPMGDGAVRTRGLWEGITKEEEEVVGLTLKDLLKESEKEASNNSREAFIKKMEEM